MSSPFLFNIPHRTFFSTSFVSVYFFLSIYPSVLSLSLSLSSKLSSLSLSLSLSLARSLCLCLSVFIYIYIYMYRFVATQFPQSLPLSQFLHLHFSKYSSYLSIYLSSQSFSLYMLYHFLSLLHPTHDFFCILCLFIFLTQWILSPPPSLSYLIS